MTDSITSWIFSIPPVTRYWFLVTGIGSIITKFQIIPIQLIYLSFKDIFYRFQIWRLLTSVLIIPFGPGNAFHFIMMLYFLYSYSTKVESANFHDRRADYLYALVLNGIGCIIAGFLTGSFVFYSHIISVLCRMAHLFNNLYLV
uniref:Derlin n=1 Tax=Henneguya salminicola TaxID=69463 RepID=A0A6G3ML15_HENSL